VTDLLGVLVAGGRGRRLPGAGPKALLELGGLTLLERARRARRGVRRGDRRGARDLALPVPAAQRVADRPGTVGPLAGIVAGLSARPFERALVLGVDFPFMRPRR